MSFDLAHIWAHMGPISRVIAGFLVLMAIASIGVVVERFITFAKAAKASRAFAGEAAPVIENWELEKIGPIAKKHKASPLARIVERMTNRYLDGYDDLDGGLSPVELARNESQRRLEATGAELRAGMNVLATVGSVSPFVGLLGTVIGIITAFAGIGASGSAGLGAVSAGISEALAETALGLMVAIPAVLFYNYLSARVATIELSLGRSVGELLDDMENNHGRKIRQSLEQAA
jgi:biopolymer transport protein ExbB